MCSQGENPAADKRERPEACVHPGSVCVTGLFNQGDLEIFVIENGQKNLQLVAK